MQFGEDGSVTSAMVRYFREGGSKKNALAFLRTVRPVSVGIQNDYVQKHGSVEEQSIISTCWILA